MTEINWELIETMCPEDIENVRVQTIKELQIMEDMHQLVKDEYMAKGREIIKLEGEKKDLQISLSKSSHTIKRKKSDLEILVTKFWQSKR